MRYDGVAVTTPRDVDPAIARVVADVSAYYLLAYNSSNTKLDGRFRVDGAADGASCDDVNECSVGNGG